MTASCHQCKDLESGDFFGAVLSSQVCAPKTSKCIPSLEFFSRPVVRRVANQLVRPGFWQNGFFADFYF